MAEEVVAGRYVIQEELGRGASATVFRARDTVLDRAVALKVISNALASDPEFTWRFEQEARLAARLDHPNIVTVHDVGTLPDGRAFIAMRLLDGQGLDRVMAEKGQLPPAEVATIIDQVAAALDYTHANGLIHRDVKPSNVKIDASGRAILTDFGIARALDSARVTLPGLTIGTPRYMPPEQVRGEDTSPASDVYSLAVMAYEMMAGRPPFDGDGTALMYKIVHEAPPSPNTFNPWLPTSVSEVIQKALSKAPEDRWPSAGSFAKALRDALNTSTLRSAAYAGSDAPTVSGTPTEIFPAAGSAAVGAAAGAAAAATATTATPAPDATQVAPAETRDREPTGAVVAAALAGAAAGSQAAQAAPTETAQAAATQTAQAVSQTVIPPAAPPEVATSTPPAPPAEPQAVTAAGSSPPPPQKGSGSGRRTALMFGGVAAVVAGGVLAGAAFLLGGDDNKYGDDTADKGAAWATATANAWATGTAAAKGTAPAGATPTPGTPTPTPGPGTPTAVPPTAAPTTGGGGQAPQPTATSVAVVPTATSVPPTATAVPPTATAVPPTATTATGAPGIARITGIKLVGSYYEVSFTSTFAFVGGPHLHFFFDTVSVANAGVPGAGPWIVYYQSSPFTQYGPAQRPSNAKQMCVLAANGKHEIYPGSGNCWDLP